MICLSCTIQLTILNQLVLIWNNTSFPPNWVETFVLESCYPVIEHHLMQECNRHNLVLHLSQLPGFTLRSMDTHCYFKHSMVALLEGWRAAITVGTNDGPLTELSNR